MLDRICIIVYILYINSNCLQFCGRGKDKFGRTNKTEVKHMAGLTFILIGIFPIVLIVFLAIFFGLTDNIKNENNNQEDTSKSKKWIKILISAFAGYIVVGLALWYICREEVRLTYRTFTFLPYYISVLMLLIILNVVSLIAAKIKKEDTEAYRYRLIVFSSLLILTYAVSKLLLTFAVRPIPMM